LKPGGEQNLSSTPGQTELIEKFFFKNSTTICMLSCLSRSCPFFSFFMTDRVLPAYISLRVEQFKQGDIDVWSSLKGLGHKIELNFWIKIISYITK
jgi:hypothetical protein